MARVKYFIDFDDVLFDRKRFWDALVAMMASEGLADDFKQTYKDPEVYKNNGYNGVWNHLEHIAAINSRRPEPKNYDFDQVRDRLKNFLADLSGYLFPETRDFIRSIDRNTYKVCLLTVGAKEFQEAKVVNSGVADLFSADRIIYTESTKEDELVSLVEAGERFILIEDKAETIEAVRGRFPQALVIQTANGDLLRYGDPLGLGVKEKQLTSESLPS